MTEEFTLTITTDNAAFEDGYQEIARLLREVADRLESGNHEGAIADFNGNRVGFFDWNRESVQ